MTLDWPIESFKKVATTGVPNADTLIEEPAATRSPRGEIATVVTPSSIEKFIFSLPIFRSQRRTVRSPLPEAMYCPS